jgi:cyclic beta-1,2-glucan synthetase
MFLFPHWMSGNHRSAATTSLRAELFSSEQLQQHAVHLATRHRIDPKGGANRLLQRLAANEKVLVDAYELVTRVSREENQVSAAGEWLLDNFYLVEQQIRATRLHLPRTYSRELPQLLNGHAKSVPRVYELALELIAHTDGRLDDDNLSQFISAYQSVAPLTLGELWAIPIMLRLGLIENLRQVSEHIASRRRDRNLAGFWATRLLEDPENPARVLRVLAELAESDPPFSSEFVQEFCGRLQGRGHGQALATVQSWVEHRLAEGSMTREQLQRSANQGRAADQVSIGHSIGSLRYVNVMDWRNFVERMSLVEATLKCDPANIYASMDFGTRDRYRHRVESIARHSDVDELSVARSAIELAKKAVAEEDDFTRSGHVGYYLVEKGKQTLEKAVGCRRPIPQVFRASLRRASIYGYVIPILAITALTGWLILELTGHQGLYGWRLWIVLIAGLISGSQMAVSVVNLLANLLVGTRPLPRLDFSGGIPDAHRTMVVVPTLLTSPEGVRGLLEGLELRYIGNRDPNLSFALLTDFADAAAPQQPNDDSLLALAREGVHLLNARHSPEGRIIFHLFHRPRLWNPHEGIWMGYERKRGKLEHFNALLRGGSREPFSEIIGDAESLPSIRYVITLDTDTMLPRDAARRLVGAMAHPLNRPRLDPVSGRVVEGYAILQPRTPISLLAANRSRFSQLSCTDAGLDPYTNEVSDVYQDLFAEGSYVGKGIYDVDAFHAATSARFPENLILSHDLVESNFARSALVTDVQLYEDHPASFTEEMSRRHRWIRGDWQIAAWLLPFVPGPAKTRLRNRMTKLGWWKIFDNLRRSLVPPAMLLLLLAGWMLLPNANGVWTGLLLVLIFIPVLFSLLAQLLRKPREQSCFNHFESTAKEFGRELAEAGIALASLPYRAFIHLDAILDSAGRMLFTRRGLLLWHTPRYARRNRCATAVEFFREMWISPVVALLALAFFVFSTPSELLSSSPLILMWLFFPALAWWISRPLEPDRETLTENQKAYLRRLSRLTWRYFEVFVNEEENWLAPDNFQEVPFPTVASRTSPTNMGMGLLSNLAATDFGYLTQGELLDRTTRTLASMEKLERYRGHFYNWYDTRTLTTLLPHYVSSVDSGNLVGALLTLRAGLLELKDQPIFTPALFQGLRDTLDLIPSSEADGLRIKLHAEPGPGVRNLHDYLADLCEMAKALPEPSRLANKVGGLRPSSVSARRHMQTFRCWSPTAKPPAPSRPCMTSPGGASKPPKTGLTGSMHWHNAAETLRRWTSLSSTTIPENSSPSVTT